MESQPVKNTKKFGNLVRITEIWYAITHETWKKVKKCTWSDNHGWSQLFEHQLLTFELLDYPNIMLSVTSSLSCPLSTPSN
jgi:hypothetical protein